MNLEQKEIGRRLPIRNSNKLIEFSYFLLAEKGLLSTDEPILIHELKKINYHLQWSNKLSQNINPGTIFDSLSLSFALQ